MTLTWQGEQQEEQRAVTDTKATDVKVKLYTGC